MDGDYIASASNNSEDLIGSDSDRLMGSSSGSHQDAPLQKVKTVQYIGSKATIIDKKSTDRKLI